MSIREFSTRYGNDGHRAFFNRDHELLIGAAKTSKRAVPTFRPFDMLTAEHDPMVVFQNIDVRFGVESLAGAAPYFRRNLDFDDITFQWAGHSTLECEYGTFELAPGGSVLVPAGVAYRINGSPGSLRVFAHCTEPVEVTMGEDKLVTHTEFDVSRVGGPALGSKSEVGLTGMVIEKMYHWEDGEVDELARPAEGMVGTAVSGRGMQQIRVFDFFDSRTGVGGPGPTFYASPAFHAEAYNTEGDMLAFHRGLDSDESWWQFSGGSTNESEYGVFPLSPGEVNHAPPGIAHRVIGTPEFLRLVLYSKRPLRLAIDPTKHLFESKFDLKVNVVKGADWMSPAWVGAGA
jgi:quercetin dioxygenase-like cupin family protein